MSLFSKKEIMLLKEFVYKENETYYKNKNAKYDSYLSKKNKDINNIYRIILKI